MSETTAPSKAKGNEVILVYARIRPPAKKRIHRNGTAKHEILENEYIDVGSTPPINKGNFLNLVAPKDDRIGGYVDNTTEKYQFSFHKIFGMESQQNDVFSEMAVPIIKNAFDGYNGTIFAYGQTGSGKTFTMTGGTSNYEDRGLIPRAISYIFEQSKAEKECHSVTNQASDLLTNHIQIQISYLEIYNNEGYDLLNEDEENNKALKDLPKVKLFEDEQGVISMSNMSLLAVNTEEEALNYLFLGDTNRMICETPNNDTSSRSHCIFTIFLQSQRIGSDKVRRSKLNLVDLAGSERVYKSALNGNILNESKYINLSLHFLEQVIIALHGKQRHIPYRNSMITTILKDSLGGNCKTVMIATLSVDRGSVFESVSTCRFSQRVALIENVTSINEQVDPQLMINRLKLQVKSLKQELLIAKGLHLQNGESLPDLEEDEKSKCQQMIDYFVRSDGPLEQKQEAEEMLFHLSDPRKIRHCFESMRRIVIYQPPDSNQKQLDLPDDKVQSTSQSAYRSKLETKIKALRETVMERDHEIDILVKMLKKHSISRSDGERHGKVKEPKTTTLDKNTSKKRKNAKKMKQKENAKETVNEIAAAGAVNEEEAKRRNEAFKAFVVKSPLYAIVEENKNILRVKFDEAKQLGMMVNSARNKMNAFKAQLEQSQIDRAMNQMDRTRTTKDGDSNGVVEESKVDGNDEEEQVLREEIESEKALYRKHYLSLKNIKVEIDHMKCMLKKNRKQIQLDFENWWQNNRKSENNKKQISEGHEVRAQVITGDQVADANIAEFYKMRDQILGKMQ